MAHRVNLRLITVAANERVVRGNAAVIANSQDFAAMALWILRVITTIRHEDRPIASECDPRRAGAGCRQEDIADLCKRLAVPASARQCIGGPTAFERLRV